MSPKSKPQNHATKPSTTSEYTSAEFKNNVTRLLAAQHVPYRVHTFSPEISTEGTAVDVAAAIKLPPEQVYKTLVVVDDEPASKPILALIPAPDTLDLKLLAKAAQIKKAKMATHQQAEQLTGLQTGGISPLALTHKPFRIYIDRRALDHPTIAVSAGQRGANVELAPEAIVRITRAKPILLYIGL